MRSWFRLGWRVRDVASSFTSSLSTALHLDPIERLWGLMHGHVTHNRCHPTFAEFKTAVLNFLRDKVPRKWRVFRNTVTDNFRIITPANFRVPA